MKGGKKWLKNSAFLLLLLISTIFKNILKYEDDKPTLFSHGILCFYFL